ncbi:MAG: frzE [Planctomycetaceae bacterium]|nr:frzE [Planctomycetaceae bacterium]
MTTVLVVDDLVTDRLLAGGLLQKHAGWNVIFATNGQEALQQLELHLPDLVLTDLMMPVMNGLQLAEAVKREFPLIPVILMTSKGSEDVAVQALQRGATNYVSKKRLNQDLAEIVEQVLLVSKDQRTQARLLNRVTRSEFTVVLENDITLLQSLVVYIQTQLKVLRVFGESERIRIGVALEEALLNAFYHGNLEVSSKLREDDYDEYYSLAKLRCSQAPYADRKITVHCKFDETAVAVTITDEGPGFDPSLLPDPRDPENLERPSGRGLLLMKTFLDEVEYNSKGNEVRMIKRRLPTEEEMIVEESFA